jgi:UDP-N-acetyl-D-mannosaminuronic acid dehydrogenase
MTTARTAELVKLAENSFRDTNIAFANELSLICDRFGINVWEALELANRHPRVNILKPGPGVGGHCIAVDPWFIVHSAPDLARVIRASREVNDSKTAYTVNRCIELIDGRNADIACLGLAFKANIDDLRESPALEVALDLARRYGRRVKVVEPNIEELPEELAKAGAELIDLETALEQCGVLVLLVDHDEFKLVSAQERNSATVYDTRGVWAPNIATAA